MNFVLPPTLMLDWWDERLRVAGSLTLGWVTASLVIANNGHLRYRRGEALAHQACCLNLVTNAVMVWKTVYMAAAVEQLKREGYPVIETDLAHIWPTRYAHINMYRKYQFNVDEARGRKGLQPLRRPDRMS